MTLTGQEARIYLRYHLPDHPNNELYNALCVEYKKQSTETLKKHRESIDKVAAIRMKESELDKHFAA